MKQRPEPLPPRDASASFRALARALAELDDPKDVAAFLEDLCTPAELEVDLQRLTRTIAATDEALAETRSLLPEMTRNP